MPLAVFAAVLVAALIHAGWNAIVKAAGDKVLTTVMVTAAAALFAAATLPFLAQPARASWPFIGLSAVLQGAYYVLLARTYHHAEMSQAYPLMRGTAPLLVALASALFMDEPLEPTAWGGIAVICAGILAMAAGGSGGGRMGVALALLNACVIAAYTLTDGTGVRRSGAPAAYTLWVFLLTGLPRLAWALAARREAFLRHVRANWPGGAIAGMGTVVSYAVALWAMTLAPVATVAALRETSILFATAISGLVLRERVGPARIAAACVIALGAAALRLA